MKLLNENGYKQNLQKLIKSMTPILKHDTEYKIRQRYPMCLMKLV